MSNAPVWGLVFYVNPPVLPPIAPGRGVVGHYIDRCINVQGYVYRQALYACATCSSVDDDGGGAGRRQSQSEPGGVCLACSLHCHDGHTLYELYTKR